MKQDKAYKLLAQQESISNSKAKELIDKGIVYVGNKRVAIARGDINIDTKFNIKEVAKLKIIFEDDDIFVVNKPSFLVAQEVANKYPNYILLNRLDKETSGVMLFAKNEAFQKKAIAEFKANRVYKEYVAIVDGKVIEEQTINLPISTTKSKGVAKSKIDLRFGKSAKTTIYPLFVEGNKSKIKVVIEAGRTHQIRVHLNYIGYPIIGDAIYGKTASNIKRVLLHSKKTEILSYTFEAVEPKEFNVFGLGG